MPDPPAVLLGPGVVSAASALPSSASFAYVWEPSATTRVVGEHVQAHLPTGLRGPLRLTRPQQDDLANHSSLMPRNSSNHGEDLAKKIRAFPAIRRPG